ncbi:MAG: DUF3052 family protein [Dehalococcoidia bacterium]|nr:DUF3052 family protein [Dehalococcoidia bacterium]
MGRGAGVRGPVAATAGYSGTPLVPKLGIKPGHRLAILGAPEDFEATLELSEGVEIRHTARGSADVILCFVTSRARLARRIESLGRSVCPDGAVWVAWPKRASGVRTDMTEDAVRDAALPLGLVDNKVCAIDATWSGLRLMWRRERRSQRPDR